MNKEYVNVIMLSGDWEFYHRREFTKELSAQFKRFGDTVCVQHPVSLTVNLFVKFRKKFLGYFKGHYKPNTIESGIKLFTPAIMTHPKFWLRFSFFGKLDSSILNFQIKRFLKKDYDGKKVLLWVYHPRFYFFQKKFDPEYLLYDSYDDNENDYSGLEMKTERKFNEMLVKESDLTLTLARSMYDRYKKYSDNIYYLPNSNNFKFLNSGKDRVKLADEIVSLKTETIGYLGNIRNWLDFNLIRSLLEFFKNNKIVFVGYIDRTAKNEIGTLLEFDNFVHIPYQPGHRIPEFIKAFTVGIIPFKVNQFTASVFPNKFFEYMACQIPIVTTALPELSPYKDLCGYSRTKEEFIQNCSNALHGKFADKIKSYPEVAMKNSWEINVEKFMEVMVEKFQLQKG